jgi:hypothetical protein
MQKEITGYKANAEMKAAEKEAAEEAARKQAQTVGVTAGSSRSLRPQNPRSHRSACRSDGKFPRRKHIEPDSP